MSKQYRFNGKTYVVPDDATLDEVQALIDGKPSVPGVSAVTPKGPVTEYTIEATGKTIPLPSSMPEARVKQIIDGHIRAVQGGYNPENPQTPKASVLDRAVGAVARIPEGEIKDMPVPFSPSALNENVVPMMKGATKELASQVFRVGRTVGAMKPGSTLQLPYGMVTQIPTDEQMKPADTKEQIGAGLVRVGEYMLPGKLVAVLAPAQLAALSRGGKAALDVLSAYGVGRLQGESPEEAATVAATVGLVPEAIRRIPRASRAAAKFEQIAKVANPLPVDTTKAEEIAQRAAEELGKRGSSTPKVIKDFIKYKATGEPVTYEVGRDFATSAGSLSARDVMRANRPMKAQVSAFAKAMKEANREVAEKVGMGEMYDAAMKEYRQARTLSDAADVLKKWSVKAAAAAAGLGAAYRIGKEIAP